MMPVIRINDATFADLASIAKWVGARTPSEAIDRLVRDTMEKLGMEREDAPETLAMSAGAGAMEFKSAPGLAFTKPISASIKGKAIKNPNWALILLTMIARIKAQGLVGDKLVSELNIPAKPEPYDEEGYRFHPNLGISVQGQSASEAWKEVDRLAKKWSIPVVVEFRWRENPKAQHPGRTGILRTGT